jgi:rhodanese-related sulfurtransferase
MVVVLLIASAPVPAGAQYKPGAPGTEITTDELKALLAGGKITVIDVRPPDEYAVSHVPGAVNIFEKEIDRMLDACTNRPPVALYCNGPFCGKTGRVAETLWKRGCTAIRRYQEGLPVWSALGNPAETSLAGFRRVFGTDRTVVFVDARTKEEFRAGSVPGAVNLQTGEIEAANKDGRLPYTNHGTRVIVFGGSADQARTLAEAIAHRAYWNISYLTATYDDVRRAGLW